MRRQDTLRQPPDSLGSVIQSAKAGDAVSITRLLRAVLGSMHRVVCQVLGQGHPDSEDVLQEAAIALVEALNGFREECSIQHFARRVALLTGLNARRRLRVTGQFVPVAATEELMLPADPGALMAQRRRQTVLSLLDELPAAQAEVLGMHFVLGYTVAETAEAVGVPINTVRSRLQAAKVALRSVIAQNRELEEELRDWSRGTG